MPAISSSPPRTSTTSPRPLRGPAPARARPSRSTSAAPELRTPLDLGGERHAAGAAAGTGGGDQDALLGLLVEIGVLEHAAHLLLKQIVQRKIAGGDLIVARRGRVGDGRGRVRRGRVRLLAGPALAFRHLRPHRRTMLIILSISPRRNQAIL